MNARTQYKEERVQGPDRRKINCYIENDRRKGPACRRMAAQRAVEYRWALSKVKFTTFGAHV